MGPFLISGGKSFVSVWRLVSFGRINYQSPMPGKSGERPIKREAQVSGRSWPPETVFFYFFMQGKAFLGKPKKGTTRARAAAAVVIAVAVTMVVAAVIAVAAMMMAVAATT